jgi:uncharacterized protein YndB with AHSA1/START domain
MNDSLPIKAQVIYRFTAPAEAVFDAWITANKVRRWFGPGLGEMSRIAIDARVGGAFLFAQKRGLQEVEHIGTYKEFARPTRLEFTWQVKGTPDSSLVSIEIVETDDGCELTLTHHLHPHWEDYRERMITSWRKMLDAMAAALK